MMVRMGDHSSLPRVYDEPIRKKKGEGLFRLDCMYKSETISSTDSLEARKIACNQLETWQFIEYITKGDQTFVSLTEKGASFVTQFDEYLASKKETADPNYWYPSVASMIRLYVCGASIRKGKSAFLSKDASEMQVLDTAEQLNSSAQASNSTAGRGLRYLLQLQRHKDLFDSLDCQFVSVDDKVLVYMDEDKYDYVFKKCNKMLRRFWERFNSQ